MECLENWIISPLGLCAGEPYRVCVCVCVCGCVCGCVWVWVCVGVGVGMCGMPGNWIVSPLGLCAGEPYRVCVCVCVWVWVWGCVCVCVECLETGSSHLWVSVQVSPMAHTCVLCVCESEIVCVCV